MLRRQGSHPASGVPTEFIGDAGRRVLRFSDTTSHRQSKPQGAVRSVNNHHRERSVHREFGRFSPDTSEDEPRLNAAAQHLVPREAPEALPVERPRDGGIRAAVAAAGTGWRCAAGVTAAIALLATLRVGIPIGAGLAIALLTAAALVDVHERRLPDAIVLFSAIVFVVSLIAEQMHGSLDVSWTHVAIGMIALAGPILVLHLVAPASMGFGDVKTAAVLGAALGTADWKLSLVALALGAGATATVALLIRAATIPFGPGLVAAAALALAAQPFLLTDVGTGGAALEAPSPESSLTG